MTDDDRERFGVAGDLGGVSDPGVSDLGATGPGAAEPGATAGPRDPQPEPTSTSGDHSAPRHRAGKEKRPLTPAERARRRSRAMKEWAIIIVIVIVGVVLLRAFVVGRYTIPSDSMEQTLHGCSGCNDDSILVNKLAYKLHGIHRGDIVVFKTATPEWVAREGHIDVVKRVIGLPGDLVRCCDAQGRVIVNGTALNEKYVYQDDHMKFPTARDTSDPWVTQTGGMLWVKVPKGELWVMGDHRGDSEDSRFLGPIPESSVIGRAFMRIWPPSRVGGL